MALARVAAVANGVLVGPPPVYQVAIKRISDVFRVETDTRRFLREIYILRRLKHPNVIRVVDVFFPGTADSFNELYIVFEVRCAQDPHPPLAPNGTLVCVRCAHVGQ